MLRSRLVVLPLAALLAACAPANPTTGGASPAAGASKAPATGSSAAPATGGSAAPAAGGANYFKVDGVPAPLSGKATIIAFSRGGLEAVFGQSVGVIPQKYLFNVEVKLTNYQGDQAEFGTSVVAKAVAKLGVDGTAWKEGAAWTPEKPDGTTFELAVKDRKVTVKWVGTVKDAGDVPHQIDALMTDVAVPFK